MAMVASAEKAFLGRYSPYGNANLRTQFIGEDRHKHPTPSATSGPTPVAFLVEQSPHNELRAHFHVANQFQIFVGGDGRIGQHHASIGLGHFTGPYSGYGPIVAGDKGVAYMTLRNAWDGGAQFLPERIEEVRARRGQRREVTFDAPPTEIPNDGEVRMSSLIAPQADGLGAWSCLVPAGASVTGPAPAQGGGQFWLVLGGQMADREQGLLARLSLAFVRPDEEAFVAEAGPSGLQVLALQFPQM